MHHWLDHHIPGAHRFGRRTFILLHGGVSWILLGWLIFTLPTRRFSASGGPLEILDSRYWGLVWITGGVLCLINAPLRKRWKGRDVIGFMGLVTPPVVWLAGYLWSAGTYLLSGGEWGNDRAWTGIVFYYLISAFVLVTAGWPDPDDPTIEPRRPRRGSP